MVTLAGRLARLEAEHAQRRRRHPQRARLPVVWDGVVIADEAAARAYLEQDRATAGIEYRVTLPGEPA